MSVPNASTNFNSIHSLDQRASVTLTADTGMGMIVAVEEAHCVLGTCTKQPASVLLHGRLLRSFSSNHFSN